MENLLQGIRKRNRRISLLRLLFLILVLVASFLILSLGDKTYSFSQLINICLEKTNNPASFVIFELRLPKLVAGISAGFSFALAGFVFQTMLRNPLASPDIIGVTSGSSLAAVICIAFLKTNKYTTGMISVIAGISVALLIFFLSKKDGFSTSKLVLIGIGFQAMLKAMISFALLKSSKYDLGEVMRWLSGSLSYAKPNDLAFMVITSIIISLMILAYKKRLEILELGDSYSQCLGIKPDLSRMILILLSVSLTAFSTSVTGPIACISFISGPIALGLGKKKDPILTGLVGICLVLASDLLSTNFLPARYPVGVVTGLIGAPYLLYLIIKMNKRSAI